MGFGQRPSWGPVLRQHATTSMAKTAGLHLRTNWSWRATAADCVARGGVYRPGPIAALGKALRQSLGRIVGFPERPPPLLVMRPGDVSRSLTVTGLTSNADLGKCCRKSVVDSIIVLAHAG